MQKVFSYMEEKRMICDGDAVIAGVSGGADSVCLLFLLRELSEKKGFPLAVVHVDHGIRKEAGRDAEFTEALCKELGVPCIVVRENVPEKAARWNCSLEDAGRRVRYEAFLREGKAFFGEAVRLRIAVAHHMEDQAETILLHLLRGSGLRGLSGMRPVRGEIIRPLLCLHRSEIEDFLRGLGRDWVEDETNKEDTYVRNRIRHKVLPAMQEISGKAAEHLLELSEQLAKAEDHLEAETFSAKKDLLEPSSEKETFRFSATRLNGLPEVIADRLCLHLLEELAPTGKDMGSIQVRQLRDLAGREGNRSLQMPFGILAVREYDEICLKRRDPAKAPAGEALPEPLQASFEVQILERASFGESEPWMEESARDGGYTKWFDYDKISEVASAAEEPEKTLMLRRRTTGDGIFFSDGRGGMFRKSIREYLMDAKIPPTKREEILLLATGSEVIWILPDRVSERTKIDANTKRIARIRVWLDAQEKGTGETGPCGGAYGRES